MKRIIISIDKELLKEIDKVNVFVSRAEFIRDCIRKAVYLKVKDHSENKDGK